MNFIWLIMTSVWHHIQIMSPISLKFNYSLFWSQCLSWNLVQGSICRCWFKVLTLKFARSTVWRGELLFLIYLAKFRRCTIWKCNCDGNNGRSIFLIWVSKHHLYNFRKRHKVFRKILCRFEVVLQTYKERGGKPLSPNKVNPIWHGIFLNCQSWSPHHNFVVIAPFVIKLGTGMKRDALYTLAAKNVWSHSYYVIMMS